MRFYSKKRLFVSITISVWVFLIVVGISVDTYRFNVDRALISGIFGTFVTLAILLPKIWWNFLLDRVRELSRALKDED